METLILIITGSIILFWIISSPKRNKVVTYNKRRVLQTLPKHIVNSIFRDVIINETYYLPNDNSYSICLTGQSEFECKLAGNMWRDPILCIVISEPYITNISTFFKDQLFIDVKAPDQSIHRIVFNEYNIIRSEEDYKDKLESIREYREIWKEFM